MGDICTAVPIALPARDRAPGIYAKEAQSLARRLGWTSLAAFSR